MGFFSETITTDKIAKSLKEFFDTGYELLVNSLKDAFKDQQISIDKEQNKELIVVPMLAIIRVVLRAFGDTSAAKNIISKFQRAIFNNYFKDKEEKNKFEELFLKRCDEYSKILNPENKDLDIQFGQIFCNHFFEREEDKSHLALATFVGGSFLNQMADVEKFIYEILSKYEIV